MNCISDGTIRLARRPFMTWEVMDCICLVLDTRMKEMADTQALFKASLFYRIPLFCPFHYRTCFAQQDEVTRD